MGAVPVGLQPHRERMHDPCGHGNDASAEATAEPSDGLLVTDPTAVGKKEESHVPLIVTDTWENS